ncbi:MAG: transporter substrate-binding domain-containing protein [Roseibium sp.]
MLHVKQVICFGFLGWVVLWSAGRPALAQEITACVDDYPPYHVWDAKTGTWSGINVETLRQIAARAGLALRFTPDIPFKRCLTMMQKGDADIMAGLLYDPDRASYMELIPYRDHSTKLFITASPDVTIRSFDDLEGLRVGTLTGYKYFPEFDDAGDGFTKVPVQKVDQLIAMLVNGRTDAAIISEMHYIGLKGRFDQLDRVRIADYFYNAENLVHISVARKGRAFAHIDRIRRAIAELKREDAFERIIRNELGTM